MQISVAVAITLSGSAWVAPAAAWLRTGVEQVSAPTAVERGLVDCKPSGNAHRVTKAANAVGSSMHLLIAPMWSNTP